MFYNMPTAHLINTSPQHVILGNIWTHFLGAVIFSCLAVVAWYDLPTSADVWDRLMVSGFCVAAAKCFCKIFH